MPWRYLNLDKTVKTMHYIVSRECLQAKSMSICKISKYTSRNSFSQVTVEKAADVNNEMAEFYLAASDLGLWYWAF